jgi:phytoene dehydrogenase-like protein
VPPAYLRRLAASRISLGSVCVYLGLARDAASLGLEDHEVFISRSADLNAHYRSYLQVGPPESLLLGCYNVTDPDFSPRGTTAAVLVSLADGRAWQSLRPSEYPHAKQQVALAMLDEANRVFPGLRDAVEVAEVSTPLTNLRYTSNPLGAIYGFANTPEDHPGARPGHRGPLSGLWFVGAWTQPGGGYEPTITSGYLAAQRILGRRRGRFWQRRRATRPRPETPRTPEPVFRVATGGDPTAVAEATAPRAPTGPGGQQ